MDRPSIHRHVFRKSAIEGGTIRFQIQTLVEQPYRTGGTLMARNVWINDNWSTDKVGICVFSHLLHGPGELVSRNDRKVGPVISFKDFDIGVANS
jgi:hypothetical protein